MIYEHRSYFILPRRMDAILARFRDHTMRLFRKHGIEVVGFWTTCLGERTNSELVYICRYKDLAERDAKWSAFQADPEWHEAARNSEVDGPIVAQVNVKFLKPTDFSPIQ